MSKKITFNSSKKLPVIIISALAVIVGASIIIAVGLSNSNKEKSSTKTKHKTEKTEETETQSTRVGIQLDSDITIPEETTVETTVETEETTVETTSLPMETQERLPMFELNQEKAVSLFPNWAENRAGVDVKYTFDCQIANILPLSNYF